MKSLWQILNEQDMGIRRRKIGDTYWTPDKLETLKKAYEGGKSFKEINRDHFPEVTTKAVRGAFHFHRKKGNFEVSSRRDNFHAYWTPQRKEILQNAINSGKSNKEIVRDHFPEVTPEHIDSVRRQFKDELEVKERPRNVIGTREFHEYWNADRKYTLGRAWKSGKPAEDIALDHFPDKQPHNIQHAAKVFGLPTRTGGPKTIEPVPLDDEARERITADLKKPGANPAAIARLHYAHPDAVRKLTIPALKKERGAPPAIIPQDHIDFAKAVRKGEVKTKDDEGGMPGVIGQRRLARALNTQFPGSRYDSTQVRHLVHNGTFGLEGERPIRPHKNPELVARRKSIWQAHLSGQSHDVIAKAHDIKPNEVTKLTKKYELAHQRLFGHKPKVAGQVSEDFKDMRASNDNHGYQTQLDHWDRKVLHHSRKAAWAQKLYHDTPDNSRHKQEHLDTWKHHESALADARFQQRKFQILTGAH